MVELNLDYTPEHVLEKMKSGDIAIEKQHKTIALKQEQLLGSLKGMNVSSISKSKIRPWLALTVDESALNYLLDSHAVKRIALEKHYEPLLSESISITESDIVLSNTEISGEGQAIVIIDTGVDYVHKFLSGKVVDGACFSRNKSPYVSLCPNGEEEQFGIEAGAHTDYSDHGTHVAGIAAGSGNNFSGVAPGSDIISIQVFSRNENTNELVTFPQEILKALEWVYNNRHNYNIAAVNMSLGGGKYRSACDNDVSAEIINDLADAGIITIAASGNNGYDNAMSSPACISKVVSIGATTKDDIHASYSNAASFLDLTAPGSSINSSVPGNNYVSMSGTSMATPHVTGTVALMKSVNSSLTVEQIRNFLSISADKVPGMNGENFTNEYGYGRINAYNAIVEMLGFDPVQVSVTGPGVVCSSGFFVYSLNDLPPDVEISWKHSDNLEPVGGNTGTSYRVAASNSSVSGPGRVRAKANGVPFTKNLWVGKPAQPTTNPSGYPTVQMGIGSMMPIWITSSPGAYGSSYIWEISGSIEEVSNIGHTCTVEATDYGWGNFWVQTTNQCGISPKGGGSVNVTNDGGGGLPVPKSFNVFPNPTSNLLTIEINEDAPNAEYYGSAEKELYLYDNAMQPVRRKKFNGKQTMLNIRSLRPDVYLLIVKTGEEQFSEKIIKSQ